ncbi:MAG: hypothetical protein ACOYB7_04165 [Mycobacterium sp.]
MAWLRTSAVFAVMIAAVLGVGGCSRAIGGTAVANPAEVGAAALLSTTCRQYVQMTPAARRDVIAAIGQDGNKLVAGNPDLWVGVAAALCTFVSPSAPVKDVVTGGVR